MMSQHYNPSTQEEEARGGARGGGGSALGYPWTMEEVQGQPGTYKTCCYPNQNNRKRNTQTKLKPERKKNLSDAFNTGDKPYKWGTAWDRLTGHSSFSVVQKVAKG